MNDPDTRNDGGADTQLIRNLKDGGCGPRQIEQFFTLREAGKFREQLRLLSRQRVSLLKRVHTAQRKVDCLDYLIFTMKQEDTIHSGRQE